MSDMEQLGCHWIDFHEIWCLSIFKKNCGEKWSLTRIMGALHGEQYTFLIISRSVLLGMGNISDRSCSENQNTHFMFSNFFLKNCSGYEIMWENIVELDRSQMTLWLVHIACWLPKSANTHSEYVILTAFPLQEWLHEHASILCCTFIACLVNHSCRGTASCSLLASLINLIHLLAVLACYRTVVLSIAWVTFNRKIECCNGVVTTPASYLEGPGVKPADHVSWPRFWRTWLSASTSSCLY
jgi:hypothetical protein